MTAIVTPRFGISWGYSVGEDGWKPGMDKNLRQLDTLIGTVIIDDTHTENTSLTPMTGDAYLVGTGATELWSGHDGEIAAYEAGTWYFIHAVKGLRAWFTNHAEFRYYDGTAWVAESVGSSGTVTPGLSNIGTIAAGKLIGNPGTAAAVPGTITIGTGLTLSTTGTLSNTTSAGAWSATGVTNTDTVTLTITSGTIAVNTGTIATRAYADSAANAALASAQTYADTQHPWTGPAVNTVAARLSTTSGTLDVNTGVIALRTYADSGDATVSTAATAVATSLANAASAAAVSTSDTHRLWTGPAIGTLSAKFTSTGGTLDITGAVTSVIAGTGLTGGTITSTGTVSLGTVPALSFMANVGTAAAVPTGIKVGAGLYAFGGATIMANWQGDAILSVAARLDTTDSILDLADLGSVRLLGNPGSTTAKPSGIVIGSGLAITGTNTLTASGTTAPTITGPAFMGNTSTSAAVPTVIPFGAGFYDNGSGTLVSTFQIATPLTAFGSNLSVNSGTLALANRSAFTLMGNSKNSSANATDVVVAGNLNLAFVGATGTLTATNASVGAGRLFGNSATAAAAGGDITVGSGLVLSNSTLTASGTTGGVTSVIAGAGLAGGTITSTGSISLATSGAGALLGNSGTAAAVPGDITIGGGLAMAAGVLSANNTAAGKLRGNSGTVAAVASDISVGTGLAFSGATLTATATALTAGAGKIVGNSGTATAAAGDIAIGSGLLLNSGTIDMATTGANKLKGNYGTAAATAGDIALGYGVSISGGTLSAIGQRSTLALAATGTVAVTSEAALVNIGTVTGTLTVGTGVPGQRLRLDVKQNATPQLLVLDASVQFGTDITAYAVSTVASKMDHLMLINNAGTAWDLVGVSKGF